jgi:hypothetical protein
MSYYQENRPAMGGLADALAMQGRLGDSTLVHMNPMEVRMLETMSPDGRLSINPETGLPEAFKLKDVAAFALPIAASIAFPMLAPAGLTAALGGVGTAAVGAGLGGFGAGLLQGKGVGDSLIQGGLSGLMSYGLGSAFAPAAPTGGVTATPSISPDMALSGASVAPDAASLATFNATQNAAAGNTPGVFARLGDSVTGAAQTPLMPETLSSIAPESYAKAVTAGAAPTYGSALTAGGSGLLSSALLAPEEMPYDIAGMDDMDAYYASRIPDLEAGRRRGRAAARSLNYPPSGSTGSQYYGMATSPGGFGTFLAADGGRVPTDLNINGEPHELSYINQEEADLLRSLGGSGQNVMGIPAYFDAGEGTAGEGAADDGSGVGAAADGSDSAPGAGMGVGGYSDAQAAAVAAAMDAAIGTDAATMGVGSSQTVAAPISAAPPDIGMLGRGVTGLFGLSPQGFSVNPDLSYSQTMGIGVPGIGSAVANAMGMNTSLGTVTGPTTSPGGGDIGDDDGGVGDAGGDSGVYGRPYGDPYNTKKAQATMAPSPAGATALRSLSLTAPRTAGDIYNAATTGGIPRFFTGMAQGGGISSLAYGGEAAPVGFANKAFEGMVPGQGTGMSDDIPFSIEGNQPALLSRDEYVLPADVVSQLGDGSSGAGADMLDNFISQVRQTKYGNTQQPAPVGPQLMTGLMRQGGVV